MSTGNLQQEALHRYLKGRPGKALLRKHELRPTLSRTSAGKGERTGESPTTIFPRQTAPWIGRLAHRDNYLEAIHARGKRPERNQFETFARELAEKLRLQVRFIVND